MCAHDPTFAKYSTQIRIDTRNRTACVYREGNVHIASDCGIKERMHRNVLRVDMVSCGGQQGDILHGVVADRLVRVRDDLVVAVALEDDGVGRAPPLVEVLVDDDRAGLAVPGPGAADRGLPLHRHPARRMSAVPRKRDENELTFGCHRSPRRGGGGCQQKQRSLRDKGRLDERCIGATNGGGCSPIDALDALDAALGRLDWRPAVLLTVLVTLE